MKVLAKDDYIKVYKAKLYLWIGSCEQLKLAVVGDNKLYENSRVVLCRRMYGKINDGINKFRERKIERE
jgi:hypothetical protein